MARGGAAGAPGRVKDGDPTSKATSSRGDLLAAVEVFAGEDRVEETCEIGGVDSEARIVEKVESDPAGEADEKAAFPVV